MKFETYKYLLQKQLKHGCFVSKKKYYKNNFTTAVVADQDGKIFELDGYGAVGMAGTLLVPLTLGNTIEMPHGGELMYLPGRKPILYNLAQEQFEILSENPYCKEEALFPVAAFNSPGYIVSYISAYQEHDHAKLLPLFSYGSVGWYGKGFRSSLILVDTERRQDLRLMKQEEIIKGVRKIRKVMPENRLRKHLEKCALEYGCPAAKNFFIGRCEAPLPTSKHCNANCLGCLSLQKEGNVKNSQDRILFTPLPEEIAQVALYHIKNVKKSVVSFGQGCEGDPLLAGDVIIKAISMIRSETDQGTINLNTNASKPEIVKKMFEAGLDSMRVSLNSVRNKCYSAYFRPKGYSFSDVKQSIDIALSKKKNVAINYLNCPGFTDTPEEVEAFIKFIDHHRINLIQWRNLNFDPCQYWKVMSSVTEHGKPIGIRVLLKLIKKTFPSVKHGYFNPPKENF